MAARNDFRLGLGQHLRSGERLPVYAIVSADDFLLSQAVAALRRRVLTQAADFNRDEFDASNTPMARVVQAASTLPMMAPTRWVGVSSLHKIKAKDLEPLLAYLDKPVASSVLCLAAEKFDLRTKLGMRLSKLGYLFVLEPPKQGELAGWVSRRAQQVGLTIEPAAAALLADWVGVQLGVLDMTLRQVAAYAGDKITINTEHVEALVTPTRVSSIFELTGAVGARDIGRASLLLRNILDGGENAIGVLMMIVRQLRQLLQVKLLEAQQTPAKQMAQAVGVPPFAVDALRRQARQYHEDELWQAIEAAAAADMRIKSTALDAGVVLERLLVDLGSHGLLHARMAR